MVRDSTMPDRDSLDKKDDDSQFSQDEENGQQPDQELQQINSINKQQGRTQIRQLIDIMLLSGIEENDIENILRELADGVTYYSEDIEWYNEDRI